MSFDIGKVKQPLGALEKAFFPGDTDESFDNRLEGYVDDAENRIAAKGILEDDEETATEAWIYIRAYETIALRFLTMARSASIEGQGSHRFEQEQADSFFALAAKWQAVFDGVIPVALAPDPEAIPSSSFRNRYEW